MALIGLLLSAFKSGGDRVRVKVLGAKVKGNEKHKKNRKLIVNMSDDELLEYLHKK